MNKKRIPLVRGVMTAFPHTVDVDSTLEDATAMMADHGIRHLPVSKGDALVGILSERDVLAATGVLAEPMQASVGMICTMSPYVVPDDTRLDAVVDEMAEREIGSVLVTRDDKLVGILTTTDVCALLAETLRDYFAPNTGTDAA